MKIAWWCAGLASIVASGAAAQVAPGAAELQEVEVHASDAGFVAAPAGQVDGGTPAEIIPPSLAQPSPAQYPASLVESRAEGVVRLELLVDETGAVADVVVAQGALPEFDAAATEAARALKFNPATLGGTPVPVRIHYEYVFQAPPPPQAKPARLTGRVRALGTRKPVPGATLEVSGAVIEADADGSFSAEVAPGTQWIVVSAAGHKKGAFREELREGDTVEVVYAIEPLVVNPYETVVRDERVRAEVSRVSLREQEIREVPGTQGDPFRVVMLLPGVASVASGVSYPVVRGSQPAATGYYIDGVRVPMLFHLLLGPAVVHPDFIDGVDFYPGVAPVRYGRLLGGVVEGQVSRPREDRLHASAYADLINAGAFVETPIEATGTTVTLAGRYSYTPWMLALGSQFFTPSDPEGYRTRGVADFWDYQGRIEQKIGNGRLRLLAFGSSDVAGADNGNPKSMDTKVYSLFHRIDLRYRQPVGVGEVEVGANWGTERVGVIAENATERFGDYGLRTNNVTARASWSAAFTSAVAASVGVDVDHRRAVSTISANDGRLKQVGARPSDASAYREPLSLATVSGVWAELQWRPIPKLLVVPGVRADNYHLVPGIDHLGVDPRITARFDATETVTVKGGAALLHQPPTVMVNLPVLDIAGIRHGLQEAWAVDAGAEWRFAEGFELNADTYFTYLSRAVEFTLEDVLRDSRRRGIVTSDPGRPGYAWGFELMARKSLGDRWFGWISYSFSQSKRWTRYSRYDDDERILETKEGWLPFAFEQEHVANLAVSYKFPNNLTVGTVVHFNTGRPESGEISSRTQRAVVDEATGIPRWVVTDRDRIERLPPFARVDLRIGYTRAWKDVVAEAYLDVLNVTASREVLGWSYHVDSDEPSPGAERTYRTKREAVEIPLILPVLGAKVTY